jgi:hypothetical protein
MKKVKNDRMAVAIISCLIPHPQPLPKKGGEQGSLLA